MNTDETPIATAPAEAPASTETDEGKPAPAPLTLLGGRVEHHELTAEATADQTRPLAVHVDRLPGPYARMGEPGRVRGSAADTRAEIKRLQELEKQQEKAARQAEADAQSRAAEWLRLESVALEDLKREMNRMVAACEGKQTQVPCASCFSAPPIVKSVFLRRPGSMDEERMVTIGSPIFLMKLQKSGSLRCPRCGGERLLAGG